MMMLKPFTIWWAGFSIFSRFKELGSQRATFPESIYLALSTEEHAEIAVSYSLNVVF
jgi:hypothetical protein